MCGFAGLWSQFDDPQLPERVRAMAARLHHRGPDDHGDWCEPRARFALAHRRLAVIDLSPRGRQPMASPSGRFRVAYNGEIYNFEELRKKLSVPWRGHSDTEVLCAAIEAWGLPATLKRCRGMFALAVWDNSEKRLQLARDRVGQKPLYYGPTDQGFAFASELKSLPCSGPLDREALALFFRLGYIPAPWSIYKNIKKLPAGTFVEVRQGRAGTPEPYWRLEEFAHHSPRETSVSELDSLLSRAVQERLVADVPVGALLSGGVDSATVVALMQRLCSQPVRTFSIGYAEADHDESKRARRLAQHLGCHHTELQVGPELAAEVLPRLPTTYDEPFADPSAIPTYLVSRLARESVTVALSGDGGDELFGGYPRYQACSRLWSVNRKIPTPLRRRLAWLLRLLPPWLWDVVFSLARPLLPQTYQVRTEGEKGENLASILDCCHPEALYTRLISCWREPAEILPGAREPRFLEQLYERAEGLPAPAWMMFVDTLSYLGDGILAKADRASMAVSLELRMPFLDPEVMALAWQLAPAARTRKRALRELALRYVPGTWLEGPKKGFGVPLEAWLRGPLRGWAEELLCETSLRNSGLLRPGPIRRRWQQHLKGHRDWQSSLWPVLMFQAWYSSSANNCS